MRSDLWEGQRHEAKGFMLYSGRAGGTLFQFVLCEKYILSLAYCPFLDQSVEEMTDLRDDQDSWRPH